MKWRAAPLTVLMYTVQKFKIDEDVKISTFASYKNCAIFESHYLNLYYRKEFLNYNFWVFQMFGVNSYQAWCFLYTTDKMTYWNCWVLPNKMLLTKFGTLHLVTKTEHSHYTFILLWWDWWLIDYRNRFSTCLKKNRSLQQRIKRSTKWENVPMEKKVITAIIKYKYILWL